MSLSHCSAKTQAALLPRDREREGERKRERGETALTAYRKRQRKSLSGESVKRLSVTAPNERRRRRRDRAAGTREEGTNRGTGQE